MKRTVRRAARNDRVPTAAELGSFPAYTWRDTVGPVAFSSPTEAVIDGVTALVFGSENGDLYVVNASPGQALPGWPRPVQLGPGQPTAIESSPTVAYLAGPGGPPTIIVGAGSTYVADQQGGLIAFNADGTVRFVFRTKDVFNEWTGSPAPAGYRNAVFSTPAVGDLLGNGEQDIVFGSWDHEIYALSPAGKLLPGFPIDNEDTVWSSAALYHVRGSGTAEDIFIGGDASGRDGCYGGWVMDYSDASGTPKLQWEHCEEQTIWSSPAVAPIDKNGTPAVVVGTGFGEKPPYRPGSDRVYAFYAATGAPVPGWPVQTAGPVFGSPAIGLLPGSRTPAVVDTSWCDACSGPPQGVSEVYAWSGSGRLLWSQQLLGQQDFASPVLVDLSGLGSNDVLVGSSAGLYPLDGATGQFLFKTSMADAVNDCSLQNAPAVFDVPGSGAGTGWRIFEACGGPQQVARVGSVYSYPLPDVPGSTPAWPMWRAEPAHDGVAWPSITAMQARLKREARLRALRAARRARRHHS